MTEERASRPNDFALDGVRPPAPPACPFCEGNERETPHEIRVDRAPESPEDGPGWSWRVVPNRYAALRIEGEVDPRSHGLFDTMNGVGAHEVIIETRDHDARFADYTIERIVTLLRVFRERTIDLHRDERFHYVQVFRNYLAAAGASLRHPHSQLIALPIVPRWLVEEVHNSHEYFKARGNCVFCDMIVAEEAERIRMVDANDDFVAFCPFASKAPFETWILPRDHSPYFQALRDDRLEPLARILKRTLLALQERLDDPPFNLIIHGAPERGYVEDVPEAAYHWHIEILPRITKFAGFEMGTGFHINPTAPERAAEIMRGAVEAMDDSAAQPAAVSGEAAEAAG